MIHRSRRVALGAILVALSLAPAPSMAQPAPDDRAPDQLDNEEARALYQAGRSAYRAGRFAQAADDFQRAYDLSRLPDFLFNVGSAAERAGDDRRALEAYRAFLASDSESPARARAEGRVRELEARQAALDAAAERAVAATVDDAGPEETEPAARPASGPPLAPWLLVGGGGAVAIVGSVLLALGVSDWATLADPAEGAFWEDIQDPTALEAQGKRRIRAGAALLGVGGVAMLGGLLWALLAPRDEDRSSAGLRLDVGPGSMELLGWF